MSDGNALEIARRLAELGRAEDAARAYALALENGLEDNPAAELEAAACVLQFGRDYQLPYKIFHSLHSRGLFQAETFAMMTTAFYEPNVKDLRSRYEQNCKRLKRYPYFFRADFLPFEDLPILFYPYSDNCYIPYYPAEARFGELIDFKEPVIRHHFFKNLENPILAEDVFSQYELEYLTDNVRKSEYVARENHIYLHYTNWAEFCAHLQCWNLRPLLAEEKFIFLIENEIAHYPIDFKAEFGIDYSQYPVKSIGVREVKRLIWHTQLSSHNGGDFFNEIFDNHPNLIVMPSLMMSNVEDAVKKAREAMEQVNSQREAAAIAGDWSPQSAQEVYLLKRRTDKDIMVAIFLNDKRATVGLDPAARIAPALFFQPHFSNIEYQAELDGNGRAVLFSKQHDTISHSSIFQNFKYIKTFTPMRRITTSHGGTVKFMRKGLLEATDEGSHRVFDDAVFTRILNRSFMTDPQERLYKDSVLVRFEDGKLNPTATFTALAAFLDLPYTESMTYCSEYGKYDPLTEGNVIGFDSATVYRTYDEFTNDAERCLIEYFMRDAYEYYGYDLHYYDGREMDEAQINALIAGCTTINRFIRESWILHLQDEVDKQAAQLGPEEQTLTAETMLEDIMKSMDEERLRVSKILMGGLRFVNRNGQPLRMMPKLELDPALLTSPLYH